MDEDIERDDTEEVPPWWQENEEIRDELDLPGYDAPTFDDGVYVHAVVAELEDRYGCQIQFVDPEPRKLSRWEIRLDGEPIEAVHRTRNADANTVFAIPSEDFETLVEDHIANSDA